MIFKPHLSVFLALFVVASLAAVSQGHELGPEKPANEALSKLINEVRSDIEKKYTFSLKKIEPFSYREQTVSGKNYFIKAKFYEKRNRAVKTINHMRIHKPLNGKAELIALKKGMKYKDPIEYFE